MSARAIAVVLLFAGAAGCHDAGPEPGRVTVAFTSVAATAGAVRVSVTCDGIGDPQPAPGYLLYSRAANAGTLDAVVVGAIVEGALFTVQIGDVRTVCSADLREVAGLDNQLAATLNGYVVQVRR